MCDKCKSQTYDGQWIIGDGIVFYACVCDKCKNEWYEVHQLNLLQVCNGNWQDYE